MSVAIFSDDFEISVPVSTERYFVSVWEKAVQELKLNLIGNGKFLYYKDLSDILSEISAVKEWSNKNIADKNVNLYFTENKLYS